MQESSAQTEERIDLKSVSKKDSSMEVANYLVNEGKLSVWRYNPKELQNPLQYSPVDNQEFKFGMRDKLQFAHFVEFRAEEKPAEASSPIITDWETKASESKGASSGKKNFF